MSRLNVELYRAQLGTLTQKGSGIEFCVNNGVFAHYPLLSTVMSLAVPLRPIYTIHQKKRSENFFMGLLPEGKNYEWLLQSLPQDRRTAYDMLRRYGKDIAGALTIYDPEDMSSLKQASCEIVDGNTIRYLLEHMPQAALANSIDTGKTSLGGVQGKIVLTKNGTSWCRVHNGYASTHILKPVVQNYPSMIYDEAFCMSLAYVSGLTNHPVWIENFDGLDALVVERYDRNNNIAGGRVHQEDFNQVLGACGTEKYQEYGGKVSAKRIARVLSRFGGNEEVKKFASQLVFAIAVGNLDMHAKNISILHFPDETIMLAPAYDHVPLCQHGIDGKMALAIGGKYIHANLSLQDIVLELLSWQCSAFSDEVETTGFIKRCLDIYNSALSEVVPSKKAYPNLKLNISSFISNLICGKRIGKVEG
ncbi:MAG: HipA domain-containing protein [Dehalococcoidia bacterium]|nr:HipA domain-containing protein [Dehalococcoidia bacterium]